VTWVRLLLESGAQGTFNLAGAERISLRQLSERIGRLIGCQPRFDEQVGDPIDLVGDTSEIERVIGCRPQSTLDMGLSKLCA
jgi:nucleoside-diphosphate-sugar epimerase